jgi:hypothetical protein
MELRVGGEGILGLGVGELAGAGEGGCRKRGESRMVEGEGRIEELDRRWRLRWRLKEEEDRSEDWTVSIPSIFTPDMKWARPNTNRRGAVFGRL